MSEQELSEKVKAGDRSAYALLYKTYAHDLYRVVQRYITIELEAQDVLHDSFLKIFEKISQFNYRQEGSLRAWMTRLCLNEACAVLRTKMRMPTIPIDDMQLSIDEEAAPSVELVERIPGDVLNEMIAAMPDGYRAVFNLYVIEERSHKEIAELLGINERSSSSQLLRAKKYLAKAINKWQQEN